ncbi:uncharacterized protein BDZ99DRAFT_110708 [Mytilinidion resinicola]|uniref:Uncharacterized protein n=1 Tax=Mytilinidion resinicola TaxID=574789 RepID=A0A6A6YAV4_9PEZI|nr:uncharacterized protein BDZ99DRAFT_110708 [Mytilinidion resinicola]KAF2805749.1 hypothetical protein BDZ99DRAFT_110708 [Mytilinidion resinicola]
MPLSIDGGCSKLSRRQRVVQTFEKRRLRMNVTRYSSCGRYQPTFRLKSLACYKRTKKSLDLLRPLEDKTIPDLDLGNLDLGHSSIDAQSNRFRSLSLVEEEATSDVTSHSSQMDTIRASAQPKTPEGNQQPLARQDKILEDDECKVSREFDILGTS